MRSTSKAAVPRRASSALAVVLVFSLAGCLSDPPGTLTIATSLPADRARLEKGFADWSREHGGTVPIRWVLLAPGDDLESLVRRRRPPDVLLGGPPQALARLANAGPLEVDGMLPVWNGEAVSMPGPAQNLARLLVLGDPRRDPLLLDKCRELLASQGWVDGYAWLVKAAGSRVTSPEVHFFQPNGVAFATGAAQREEAHAFRRFLAETGQLFPALPHPHPSTNSDADALLVDLLGATLVDARDELVAAWSALDRAGHPERASRWLLEPLPWPPASVGEILKRDENAMPLLETLAAQVAPDADVRAWLIRSWLSPARSVDGALLDELAGAVNGRLVREPRFRAWLRAEWRASARQRYRRVARLTQWGAPP